MTVINRSRRRIVVQELDEALNGQKRSAGQINPFREAHRSRTATDETTEVLTLIKKDLPRISQRTRINDRE